MYIASWGKSTAGAFTFNQSCLAKDEIAPTACLPHKAGVGK